MLPLVQNFSRYLLLLGIFMLQVQLLSGQDLHSSLHQKTSSRTMSGKFTPDVNPNRIEKDVKPGEKECRVIDIETLAGSNNARLSAVDAFEEELQKNIEKYKQKMRSARTQATVYTIPVIVHIVHNGEAVGTGPNLSAAQIRSQIDVLNEDFRRKAGTAGFNTDPAGADIEIEFALALRDPNGNTLAEPGIHRYKGGRASWPSFGGESDPGVTQTELKPKTIWDPTLYFNIWSLSIEDNIIGEAQFPIRSTLEGLDIPGYPISASTDGVIIDYRVLGRTGNVSSGFTGRTATHEIGHWLGLRHIWGDDNGGCTKDDYCNDTPKTADKHRGCPGNMDSCTDAGKDMVKNYMDYTDDACVNVFTNDQKTRMRTVLETCPRRKELLSSTVHIPVSGSTPPIAKFSASRTVACANTTIQFTDASLGNVTGWNWVIYNSASTKLTESSLQNPAFIFSNSGLYSVELVAINAIGKDTLLESGYITILPSANLVLPFHETFEGTSALANWLIYNPDGDVEWQASGAASAHGTGTQSFYFDNFNGDDENNPYGTVDGLISTKLDLAVNQFAELTFDVAYARYDDSYSDSLEILYSTDCGQTFHTFWEKGGQSLATAPDTDAEFTPSSTQWRKENISLGFLNGNASVFLVILNKSSWGNNMYIDNIKINVPVPTQKPDPSFYVLQQTVCTGTKVKFNDTSQHSPRNWNWSFPGGTPATSTQQHPVVTYQTPGTYAVSLTVSNPLGSNTITQSGYITVLGNPVVQITANKTAICSGDSITLNASGAATYRWLEGKDFIGEGNSIVVKPTASIIYTVEGKNAGGCINLNSIQIAVDTTNLPEQPGTIAGLLATCLSTQNYSVASVTGLTYTWQVSSGGTITSTGNTATVNWTSAGKHVLSVVASNSRGCASPLRTVEVTVSNTLSKPIITVTAPQDSSTITLTSSIAQNYQWFNNGTAINGATGRNYNVKAAGTYTVQVSNEGCSATSDPTVLTGDDYIGKTAQKFTLFPNPVADRLHFKLPAGPGTFKIQIYNSIGKRVDELNVEGANREEFELSVSHYPKGRYLLFIIKNNTPYSQSFIKF